MATGGRSHFYGSRNITSFPSVCRSHLLSLPIHRALSELAAFTHLFIFSCGDIQVFKTSLSTSVCVFVPAYVCEYVYVCVMPVFCHCSRPGSSSIRELILSTVAVRPSSHQSHRRPDVFLRVRPAIAAYFLIKQRPALSKPGAPAIIIALWM